ncbi:UDP-2,4-diacetamido-2,4,6-trideoxy-beta-L-altropyranose hydrolase [Pseudomonas matsuisoli]|uniref:UDP-2,4-diacetamido-2,4, 6-trideoxy-beta-L-altropyranose hydrolase n=1 Tax=Pseudomonas matsuisoli TaxID=1515666 RepID=A0A917Q2Z4_9PSED|nr:UDP-2,4-diacetamido-2,4,6-trideoxy-beta-L-altropyranose hydrolase [Pseudomonas matsuisoli]GGK09172.1 UDP-2,4-diacetamido-2,4,6-trideoxy-beta-L-altropyranose hydrolase [Pseudomonas matsuisoli]
MNIVFRVDASLAMGTGHVMRCLTLARALREQGHACLFISREHDGNLNALIGDAGFGLHVLPIGRAQDNDLYHSRWLGASQAEDAAASQAPIAAWRPHWLVVDHYALDHRWEALVTPAGCRVLVIDDLADRCHVCDLLLDQNLGRHIDDYRKRVPDHCTLLVGPGNALLRADFSLLRHSSLIRRERGDLQNVLIALGGVDQHNHTGNILDALNSCELPDGIRFTVVLGATAPHLQAVTAAARSCPWPVEVLSGIDDMPRRMAEADLAVGAAGGTSWERCCLGVPTLMVILAENQKSGATALAASGAAVLIDASRSLVAQLQCAFDQLQASPRRQQMAIAASRITDGQGTERLLQLMESSR